MNRRREIALIPLVAFFATALASPPAQASTYDVYRADYFKGAFCSAIGGACASDIDLENAFFQNPAALTAGGPTWNFDGDYQRSPSLEPGMRGENQVIERQFMGGIGWSDGRFGIGFSVTGRRDRIQSTIDVTDAQNQPQKLPLTTRLHELELNLPVGIQLDSGISIGLKISAIALSQSIRIQEGATASTQDAGDSLRWRLTAGVIVPLSSHFRVGSWWSTPVTQEAEVQFSETVFNQTLHFQENVALHLPWIWAWGGSWMPWEDARTFFLDLNWVGTTPHGYLFSGDTLASSLGQGHLREKGRSLTVEPHLGYRTPWGKNFDSGNLMGGIYYEPSRWQNLPGRLHFTAGISYHAFTWLELMMGGDVARDFFQLFLTFR